MVADDRKYTKSHEWVMVEGDTATVGVTEYAAHELGDVVFLDLPEVGREVNKGEPVGTIETVKAVEDLVLRCLPVEEAPDDDVPVELASLARHDPGEVLGIFRGETKLQLLVPVVGDADG